MYLSHKLNYIIDCNWHNFICKVDAKGQLFRIIIINSVDVLRDRIGYGWSWFYGSSVSFSILNMLQFQFGAIGNINKMIL